MSTLATLKMLLVADVSGVTAGLGKAEGAIKAFVANPGFGAARMGIVGLGLAAVAAGGLAVKMAGDYQQAAIQLVTGAGESRSNLKMVTDGILQMSTQVGFSAQDLIRSMYVVESSGHHGADGLLVQKAAAEAAKAGNADLGSVTNALTSIMASYHLEGQDGIRIANELIATEQSGKLRMDDLANSLSAVVPLASSVHIGFDQVGGAIATMTNHGESAQNASQNLANGIRSLINPNSVAVKSMAQMGVSAVDVSQNIGKRGLTGTIGMLEQAVMQHMGPAGLVIQSSFNQSKAAAQDAQIMLSKLPPSLQTLGREYLNNQITQKEWMKALKGSDSMTYNLGRQFSVTAKNANGFNSFLKSGSPDAMTYTAILAKMMGGATGLNVALMLGGGSMPQFQQNVRNIGDAAKRTGKDVHEWDLVQSGLNFKMANAKDALGVAAIQIGTKLLPAVSAFLDKATPLVPVVVGLGLAFADKIVPAVTTLAPFIGAVAGAWALWNAGLLITKGIGIVSMILEFVSGMSLAGIASNAMAVAQWALNVAMYENPIGVVLIGLAALAIGFIWAYKHIAVFRDGVNYVWDALKRFGGFVSGTIWPLLQHIPLIGIYVGLFKLVTHWKVVWIWIQGELLMLQLKFHQFVAKIVGFFKWLYDHNYYFKDLVDGIRNLWQTAQKDAQTVWNAITGFLGGVWNAISGTTQTVWNAITGFLSGVWQAALALASRVWGAISGAIGGKLHEAWDAVTKIAGQIGDVLGGLGDAALKWGENLITQLIQGITNKVGDVGNAAGKIAGQISKFLGFHSPTEAGPGADADKWMPNLVTMMAGGLSAHRGRLGLAASGLAGELSGAFAGPRSLALGATMTPGGSGDMRDVQATLDRILQAHLELLQAIKHGADITGIEAKLVSLIDKAQRGNRKGVRLGYGAA
ncbi:phage tail tape measure protein [bacterium]|nr:MAG: phage tail tape measure protein [bacterium]